MTELTEHAKTILRAIADGKQLQRRSFDGTGEYIDIEYTDALKYITNWDVNILRVAPETRSINGQVFAAPVQIGYSLHNALPDYAWVEAKDRDIAAAAIKLKAAAEGAKA